MTPKRPPKCLAAALAMLPMAYAHAAPSSLDNPQPHQAVAGIGLISGWHCDARRIEFAIDGAPPEFIPSGSNRPDTAGVCGGKTANGFGYTIRWNNFPPGEHGIVMLADGVEFARTTFKVVDMGPDMIYGVDRPVVVNNFPWLGRGLVLNWNSASQAFTATEARFDAPGFAGTWSGADLERRTNCARAENNGNHGTWAQYAITFAGGVFGIQQTGFTGLNCTYQGSYTEPDYKMSGTYSCNDGKTGNFVSTGTMVTDREISLQLAIKLTGTESCTVDATIGGSRF